MFELALGARLPLICIQSEDPYHVSDLMQHLTGEQVAELNTRNTPSKFNYLYTYNEVEEPLKAYKKFLEANASLVVVNPDDIHPAMFNAGVVGVPLTLIREYLHENLEASLSDLDNLVGLFNGLSLKEVYEVVSMASARYHAVTEEGVLEVRRLCMSSRPGIHLVNTNYDFYVPEPKVEAWLSVNAVIFGKETLDRSLVPRGLLFDGPPGIGKTMAAKCIARRLSLPLWYLSLGSMMEKWVGASESNLTRALQAVDQASPCCVLIDEVEKVFTKTEDSGVTSRMLATLLWWTQEHDSRVITLMTTNDLTALPPEVYRRGRIDQVITLQPLDSQPQKQISFVKKLCHHYASRYQLNLTILINEAINHLTTNMEETGITYSVLTGLVVDIVKRHLVEPDNLIVQQ